MMNTLDLMRRIAETHNRIAEVRVCGDSAILVADTLRDLRAILLELQQQADGEEAGQAGGSAKQ